MDSDGRFVRWQQHSASAALPCIARCRPRPRSSPLRNGRETCRDTSQQGPPETTPDVLRVRLPGNPGAGVQANRSEIAGTAKIKGHQLNPDEPRSHRCDVKLMEGMLRVPEIGHLNVRG